MKARLDYFAASPETMTAMLRLEHHAQSCGLEPSLIELVKTRASQINGCAYCIHMHSRDALAADETAERLMLLSAWRESPLYSPRERAALAWTAALTRLADTHAPDADYAAASEQFTDAELVRLTLVICTINAWNRFAVGFRSIHHVDAPGH